MRKGLEKEYMLKKDDRVLIYNFFNKLKNEDTFFLTGTDEHGQKVEKAALTQNTDTQIFVDGLDSRDMNPA